MGVWEVWVFSLVRFVWLCFIIVERDKRSLKEEQELKNEGFDLSALSRVNHCTIVFSGIFFKQFFGKVQFDVVQCSLERRAGIQCPR